MPKTLSYAALAAALAVAGPALAQYPAAKSPPPSSSTPPSSTTPPSTSAPTTTAPSNAAPTTTAPPSSSAPTGSTSDTAANAGASTTLTTGMSVKDNTGAIIGEVKALKGGVATIAMGSDTFTVDASKLGVQGGAATINATQAEIRKMLPGKK